jgi:hypothetical protein
MSTFFAYRLEPAPGLSRASEFSPMAAVKAPRWRSPAAVMRFPRTAVNVSRGSARVMAVKGQ